MRWPSFLHMLFTSFFILFFSIKSGSGSTESQKPAVPVASHHPVPLCCCFFLFFIVSQGRKICNFQIPNYSAIANLSLWLLESEVPAIYCFLLTKKDEELLKKTRLAKSLSHCLLSFALLLKNISALLTDLIQYASLQCMASSAGGTGHQPREGLLCSCRFLRQEFLPARRSRFRLFHS